MFSSVRSISDHQLLANTDNIVVQDRKLTLKLLVHLHEIERRKLYLTLGYSSMFDYCRSRLCLSEGAAVRRIKTSRCLARFPQLYRLIATGEVNLMSVALVSRVMKPENADSVIARIRGKSKREVEAMVAEYEPRTLIPPDRVTPVMVPVARAISAFTATGGGENSSGVECSGDDAQDTIGSRGERSTAALDTAAKLERRNVVQFTAREEFMAKVERARVLLSHQIPGATFEQLFEVALDELIDRRDPDARQKRRQQHPSVGGTSSVKNGKRYVPAAVRDDVFVRDGFRCTFVGPDGRRCTASVCLQVDHVNPVARGGASTRDNLRILCAAHNRLEADRLMGPRARRDTPTQSRRG
jgi:5-methylcytosine-specific restriction endonuclease McrA